MRTIYELEEEDIVKIVAYKFNVEPEIIDVSYGTKTTNMGTMFELTYNVFMKSGTDEKAFIDDLRMRNGNLNIILGYAETNQEILN